MPRNRTSTDLDHVIADPKPTAPAKMRPPELKSLPAYEPMHIKQPFRSGIHILPSHVNIKSPYEIFGLFFDPCILQKLAIHTNKYAEQHQPDPTKFPEHRK